VTGVRPSALNSVPRLFSYVKSPEKRRLEREMESYKRRQALKKRRLLALEAMSEAPERNDVRSATAMQRKNNEELNDEDNEGVTGEDN